MSVALLGSPQKRLRKEACWTLSNITAGPQHHIQAVIDADLAPPLLHLLARAEFDIREGLSCPTCRAIEPPTAGDVPAEQLSAGECPVCLDSSDSCLTLQCGHRICQSCWKKWALADGGQQAALFATDLCIDVYFTLNEHAERHKTHGYTGGSGKNPQCADHPTA